MRPHAEGGLGKVSVALDGELNREVALKEIQEQYADHSQSRSRFLLEAEITGGLEHPSIVPVYGLGQYDDGRPFYAMRFIRGDSLKEAIERFHKTKGSLSAGQRALELRQLLGRFNDVCDAIAYAHSRGVLHRDLKPGNVMLGKYGETLVVDWGLAKPVGGAANKDDDAEGPLQPLSADGSAPTQMGSAIGTPQFMPPEQAAGRLDQMGPASDVYSLGATLYCLLTGKPPFTDRDVGVVLQKVQRGDFPPPRQVRREIPRALEGICLKAMALRPEERYPTARALAGDIEKWLADEPVSAWREPWRVRAGRWARRHQTLVAATAAALLVAILAGGAGAWMVQRQWLERRQAVEADLGELGLLQGQARWGEARAVLDQATHRLGGGGMGDLILKLVLAERELNLVERLDAVRLKRAGIVNGRWDIEGVDQGYQETFHQAGMTDVGGDSVAAAAWVRGSSVRGPVVAALDDWASCAQQRERRDWLLEVARRADPDPWRDRARDPAVWEDGAALDKLASDVKMREQPPQLLVALSNRLEILGGDPQQFLRTAQDQYPADFWVNFALANALMHDEKTAEDAISYYRVALALRPDIVSARFNLGIVLGEQGKADEAAGENVKAQTRRQDAITEYLKVINFDPKIAAAHNGLGSVLSGLGMFNEAAAEFRKAIELDPMVAGYCDNLGAVLLVQGKREEAAAEFRKAIELDPKWAKAHCALGVTLLELGRLAEARQAFQRGMGLLPAQDPLCKFASEQLQTCERILALDVKLPAILKGESSPADAGEQVGLGRLCYLKKRYADSARFYSDAFAAQPALADDLHEGHRYNAACAAALAADGKGEDADKIDEKDRARLQCQAFEWLRADLALWGKQEEVGPRTRAVVRTKFRHWQMDPDLASVRDAAALEKLPEAERAEWKKLWDDVAELLKKVGDNR